MPHLRVQIERQVATIVLACAIDEFTLAGILRKDSSSATAATASSD
jgi:hypothetical protein